MAGTRISKSMELGGLRIDFSARFSPTARRARIRIGPSGIEVVLPSGVDQARAEGLLKKHSSWVLDQLAFFRRLGTIRARAATRREDTILLRGALAHVDIVWEDSDRRFGIVEQNGSGLRIRVPSAAVDPEEAVQAWLRRQARKDIEARLEARGRQMRRRPGRLFIMDQRTRWGGCSGRGNVSFNWRLVMAPPDVLDYVVVHELAHLVERNHSKRFWLVVRSYCPDYERHKAWLRHNGDRLRRIARR